MRGYTKTIHIEFDAYTARRLMELAAKGGFGDGLKQCDFENLVINLIHQRITAAGRKISRAKKANLEKEQKRINKINAGNAKNIISLQKKIAANSSTRDLI